MSAQEYRLKPGSGARLGATWDGAGTNFALFSANAEKVELCLFNPSGRREVARIALPEYTHQVWHGYLEGVRPGQLYGYRVHGPYAPEAGHRFNPNKLLLDPYARAHKGELRWHDSMFGYRVGGKREDLSFDRRDSAFVMPKCVVVDDAYTWGTDRKPDVPWAKTVIYEAHVGGLTLGNPKMGEAIRGTFEGLADASAIAHLKRLGVTSLELLPIHAFHDDRNLVDKGLVNWWGYNTLSFFAPAQKYVVGDNAVDEFRVMVRRLHDAGIEVILDVVYNHTAEGNQMGPTLSLKGIDNASYYMLGDDPRYYFDTTGTGNSLNMANRRVLQMVMDSLRYWVEDCHVDGFRFDLASTLGRRRDSFDPHAPFFDAVLQDPVLSQVKMIAEPWDTGNDGYQVGGFPPGWAEWNDQYRDTVRAFWKGDGGQASGLADKLLGSASIFEHRGRRPWATINFVTAHDGFTLMDLVSYNDKHNDANGEDNRDGHSHNVSWNHGVEGPTDDPEINELRTRQRRNLITTVLMSQGVPMLLMGDEQGRSQDGNNNTYCQPGEMNWFDWSKEADPFSEFVRGVIAVRESRALLTYERFLHDSDGNPEHRYVTWQRPEGGPMEPDDWNDPERRVLGLTFHGAEDRTLMLLLNAGGDSVDFALPEGRWDRLVDTETGVAETQGSGDPLEGTAHLAGRSLLLLEAKEAVETHLEDILADEATLVSGAFEGQTSPDDAEDDADAGSADMDDADRDEGADRNE